MPIFSKPGPSARSSAPSRPPIKLEVKRSGTVEPHKETDGSLIIARSGALGREGGGWAGEPRLCHEQDTPAVRHVTVTWECFLWQLIGATLTGRRVRAKFFTVYPSTCFKFTNICSIIYSKMQLKENNPPVAGSPAGPRSVIFLLVLNTPGLSPNSGPCLLSPQPLEHVTCSSPGWLCVSSDWLLRMVTLFPCSADHHGLVSLLFIGFLPSSSY